MHIKDWIKVYTKFSSYPQVDDKFIVRIGWGRNIDEEGISRDEADLMFDNDIKQCEFDLSGFTWYEKHPQHVKYALIHMCFILGIRNLLSFKKMIAALLIKDYTKASLEVLNSNFAHKNEERAKDIALMMREHV